MLIQADAKTRDITTAASNSSSNVATDPSIPPSDGVCHFMRLPPELRLVIAEDIFEELFTRFTLGLYPRLLEKGEGRLPYTQELFSVLHINRAFRVESLDICTKLAIDSSKEVVSQLPSSSGSQLDRGPGMPAQSISIGTHKQLKLKHRKILRILQGAKKSAGEAESGVSVPDDLLKALRTCGSEQPRSEGREGRMGQRNWI